MYMSKDKQKYLAAYVPESVPKETPKRSGIKSDGRTKEIEDAIAAFNELLAKQNRDNLDAMYNIDMDNMSSSMRRLFQSYDDGITKANASIESWANAQEAGFKAIAEWIGTDEDGNLISSAAAIKGAADANHASIEALAKLVDADSKALAGFKTEVSKTYATTAQFSSFQTTVNNTITNSYAGFVTQADAKYAKAAQIASVTDANGNVTAASIAAEIKDDTSLIKLIADKVDISGFVTFESLENDGGATINGNNVSLVGDYYGDSVSELTFYKMKYSSGDTLDALFKISTYDIGEEDENGARFGVLLETYSANFGGDDYRTALKLASRGGMSMESKRNIYMSANRYCTIDAEYNTRIVANDSYADACMYGYAAAPGSYVFCTDGIYFIDSDGGANWIAGL
jgi:hypothetical protein